MGLRLSVREQAWREHVATVAAATPGLIPVVKGNGYGFGRANLMPIAAGLGHQIAVGTVFEAADVPANRQAVHVRWASKETKAAATGQPVRRE